MKVIKIPPSVHSRLKIFCATNNTPMWYLAGEAISKEIELREKKPKSKPAKK